MAMIRLQQNRYLWVHFAGLACVPLLLDICLAGLASAGSALAFQGQFWAIALLSITPALAMQWFKPFYVFSLPPAALKPAALSEDQRRCLQIFKSWQIKGLAIAVAIFSLWLLAQLYAMLPQTSPLLGARAGLVSAALAFFLASTFMQISVSAGRALLISPTALKRVAAVDEGAIASDFLILGIRVNKLLPNIPVQTAVEADNSNQSTETPTPAEVQPNTASVATNPTEKNEIPPEEEAVPLSNESIAVADESTKVAAPIVEENETEIVIPETLPRLEADDVF